MNSTVKIALQSGINGSIPIIKIIQPRITNLEEDLDVRDQSIKDFLQRPSMVERNHWFVLDTYGPNNFENPVADISTIAAVPNEHLFYKFRHTILNKLIAEEEIVETNRAERKPSEAFQKINDFFDWVDKYRKELALAES